MALRIESHISPFLCSNQEKVCFVFLRAQPVGTLKMCYPFLQKGQVVPCGPQTQCPLGLRIKVQKKALVLSRVAGLSLYPLVLHKLSNDVTDEGLLLLGPDDRDRAHDSWVDVLKERNEGKNAQLKNSVATSTTASIAASAASSCASMQPAFDNRGSEGQRIIPCRKCDGNQSGNRLEYI